MSNIELYKKEIGNQYRFGENANDGTIDYFVYTEASKADILSQAYKLIDVKDEELEDLLGEIDSDVYTDHKDTIQQFIKSLFGVE